MLWRSLIFVISILLIATSSGLAFQGHDPALGQQETSLAAEQEGVLGEAGGAQEGHSGTDAVHEGTPDVFSGTWITPILTLAVFVVLLAVLGKWAWGPILSGLQKREEHIRQSIEEAEKARADGEKALAEYKEKLAEAQGEAQAIIDKGRADAVALADELKQKAQEEGQHLRAQAARDISSAKDQALKEMYDQSVNLAADIAGRIIHKELNAEDHRELLQESLNKLQE